MFSKAVEVVIRCGVASTSILQNNMNISYPRAAKLIDMLEANGIIGPYKDNEPREVYYSKTRPQNNNIGFEEDPIFLLSATEYEHYKNKIPFIQGLWWLRSPGNNFRTAASVFSSNNANYYSEIEYCSVIVRPAIKYSSLRSKITKSSCCNNRIIFMDHPFRIIDPVNEIAIAEVPIALNQFDVESNDYETSCVRRKLLKWFETGTWY